MYLGVNIMKGLGGCSQLLPFLFLLGGLLHGISGLSPLQLSKNVNVAVQAKWTSTPLLLEAGELLAKYQTDLFWSFVDHWLALDSLADSSTHKDCVDRILTVANRILDGPLQPVFHFSLLLRSSSPQLVVHRQLAQESLTLHSLQDTQTHNWVLDRWSSVQNPAAPQQKCCWVDVGSHAILDEPELLGWLKTIKEKSKKHEDVELYDFDHIYPGYGGATSVAILYGALGTSCFGKFHFILAQAANQGYVKYILRPVLATGCEGTANKCSVLGSGRVLNLGGYGVELALKNMEYKAIDDSDLKKADVPEEARAEDATEEIRGFIFSKLVERKPELADDLMNFRDHLLSSSVSDTLNVWELKDLGYQTAQRILQATDSLQSMQDINQNFPNLVSSISRLRLNETIKEEIVANQQLLSPGKNLFAINGALINIDTLDLYSLMDIVLGELLLADSIFKLHVPSRSTKDFMQIPDPSELNSFRVDFRSDYVHYLNNLEEDAMYKRWRNNVQELLMPVFPGQLRYIRKNLFHAVYVIDPAVPLDLKIVDTIMYYYENMVPMRFGLLLMSYKMTKDIEDHGGELPPDALENGDQDDVSTYIIRLFLYVKDNYGLMSAFQFLSQVYEAQDGDAGHENELVDATLVEEAFIEVVKRKTKIKPAEVLQKLTKGSEYKEQALQSSMFVYKLGIFALHPCLIMNGLVYGPSQVQEGAITAMNEELPRIQEGVYYRHINSKTDVLDKFLKENGYSRYNPQIVTTTKEQQKYVSLAGVVTSSNSLFNWLRFLHSPGTEDDVKPVTHLLSVDILCKHGLDLLQQAIRYLINGSEKGRVGVLFNVPDVSDQNSLQFVFIRIFLKAMTLPSGSKKVLPFLQTFLSWYKSNVFSVDEGYKPTARELVENATELAGLSQLKLSLYENWLTDKSAIESALKQIIECSSFLSIHLGLKAGSNAIVTNGKVFVQNDEPFFIAEDFLLLETVEYDRRVRSVAEIVEKVEWEKIEPDDLTSDFLSTTIMAISSAITLRSRSSDTARFDLLQSRYSAIVRQSESATVHVDAIIDPLSATGQKLSPLLLLLQHWFKASMRIFLNPMNSLADLPLKNFYRYVSPDKHAFTPDGDLISGPTAVFSNLPPTRTLTMNLDVPESWLIEPVEAIYDLDNIVLEKLGKARTMFAIFELEALVLTGHCYENNNPPRGLQLLLGTKLQPHMVDTIVMANLGYWQLKAAPGVWTLSLALGRSSELYTLRGPGEGTEKGPRSKRVVIKDLGGELIRLEVVKKKGKEDQTILGSGEDIHDDHASHDRMKGKTGWNKNLFKWASDFLGGGKQFEEQHWMEHSHGKIIERHGEFINIFSIASGHLYERFLKIMMISVMKNTRRPVKFWFIKNYLSPQFKDFIPHMAKEYGFEYDLITYKWPTWLHKQTEKQRIIWAYKILFLDVIFPLSLKKVIFVDADQIIRADMGDLYDMDLKGKPLAYTPFCDNNKEMDGYRFWNQGFWKEHLRGKPYHISALYVVDLVKFRQTAAGDTLRVFYETLSKDPGSLSNLDQDLPNYAQHTVPIFSLPQEWLWCESWCGNATKAKAKTIDLCNNPMTKEPKLQGARRIVPEWSSLDEEARQLTSTILGDEMDANPAQTSEVTKSSSVSSLVSDLVRDTEEAAEL